MTLRSWLTLATREFRGSAGRLVFFAACLSVGVAAVVSVAGLSTALDEGIQAQARQLLAADIAVDGRRPIADETLAAIDALAGAVRADVRQLPTVVSVPSGAGTPDGEPPGESLLVELKAVAGGYPFYGEIELDPPLPLATLLAGGVVVGPELLERLALAPGDTLRVGEALFPIAGTVTREPDRLGVSFTLGPRVFVSMDGLRASGLTGRGSRVEYRALVRLPGEATPAAVRAAADLIRAAVPQPEFVGVESYLEAQPSLRQGLSDVERFLGLVALLSLLIGGIGVAQAVRAWLAGRLDAIAILRAIGARPWELFLLYLGQTIGLGLVGSLGGAVAGTWIAQLVPRLLGDLLPVEVAVGWQPLAMLRGMGLGIGVALLFGLRPLTEVMRVPPARVLRRDADPLPVSRVVASVTLLVLLGGIAATAALQSGSLVRGLWFAGGLVAATAVLGAGAWLVMWGVGRLPRTFGAVALRHGLAALGRPGAGTLGAVVALGLGVLVVLGMFLVQERLTAQLDADIPDDAPSVFLVDIQPDQWGEVRGELTGAGADRLDSVEVVIARLRAIDGVPVSDLVKENSGEHSGERGGERTGGDNAGRRRWVLTREQRLTSMAELPADNEIVAGALWSVPDRAEVSIERDFAADLGVGIGAVITFDVQGVPVELLVSSLRTVEWERFSINFFLVVEPGVLDEAPRFRVAAARLAPEAEQPVQNTLAATFPNITMLRIRQVLDKVVAILEQVGFGIRLLGTFTVLAGIAILAGAVSAGGARRGREVALYKTLGMTRAQVATAFAVEYALVGLVAGVIGTVGGVVQAWIVTRYGFRLDWAWHPGVYLLSIALMVVLTVVAGLAASVRALLVRPLTVLRATE